MTEKKEKKSGAERSEPQWKKIRRRFFRHRLGVIGLVITLVLFLLALFANFISPYHMTTQHKDYSYAPPARIHFLTDDGNLTWPYVYALEKERDEVTWELGYTENKKKKYPIKFFVSGDRYKFLGVFPTRLHLFGTGSEEAPVFLFGADQFGRDLFSRVMWGARVSMTIGPLGILISFTLGIVFGGISGYFGGSFDMLIQRFTEVVMSFPQLPLWLALRAAFPDSWNSVLTYLVMVMILAFVNWAKVARVIRGQFLSLKEKEFSMAAKALGCSDARIIFRHILPGTTSYLIVAATIAVPGYILGESSLSFLGLGIREPMASWGLLLKDAQSITNLESHPWLMIPGVFIIIAVLAFNFMGDALRDAADPFADV